MPDPEDYAEEHEIERRIEEDEIDRQIEGAEDNEIERRIEEDEIDRQIEEEMVKKARERAFLEGENNYSDPDN